jgi:hypothetical protein
MVIGMTAGPFPSVPAIAVARSWCIVPITSPMVAILNDDIRLGSVVDVRARQREGGRPKLKKGWPNA